MYTSVSYTHDALQTNIKIDKIRRKKQNHKKATTVINRKEKMEFAKMSLSREAILNSLQYTCTCECVVLLNVYGSKEKENV